MRIAKRHIDSESRFMRSDIALLLRRSGVSTDRKFSSTRPKVRTDQAMIYGSVKFASMTAPFGFM